MGITVAWKKLVSSFWHQKSPVFLNGHAKSPNLLPNSINNHLLLMRNNPKKEIISARLLLNTSKPIQGCHCLSFPRPPESLHYRHLQFMLWIQNCFMSIPSKLPWKRDPSLLIPLFCLGPTFLAALGDKWEPFYQIGFLWISIFLAHSTATQAPVLAKRRWQGSTSRRENRAELPLWVARTHFLELKAAVEQQSPIFLCFSRKGLCTSS